MQDVVITAEVKALAHQTAEATEDIRRKIGSITEAARYAINDITEIAAMVGNLAQISRHVSSSMEQQQAATEVINTTILSTSSETSAASRGVLEVHELLGSHSTKSEVISALAVSLGEQQEELDRRMLRFFEEVRVA